MANYSKKADNILDNKSATKSTLKNRDHVSKQALIDYLLKDTDERLWQAVANFGTLHGLIGGYLGESSDLTHWKDLFFQEADDEYMPVNSPLEM